MDCDIILMSLDEGGAVPRLRGNSKQINQVMDTFSAVKLTEETMQSTRYRWMVVVALLAMLVPVANAQWSGTNPVTTNSNVGIGPGAASPASILHIAGPSGVNAITVDTPGNENFRFQSISGIANWGALTLNANYTFPSGWSLDETAQNGWFFKIDGRGINTASVVNGLWLYRIPSGAGFHTDEYPTFGVTNGYSFFKDKVGIGTDSNTMPDAQLQVVGSAHISVDLTVDGNIAAKYQDIAEWVPARERLTAGTVVVLDPERENEVKASSHAYDTTVAGVVSAQPGITLGAAAAGKVKVATTGRVVVHVDAGSDGIKIGDLLVTSDKRGTAIRSEPMEIQGRKFHQPGTVIGKALQPLASGEGEILVLLSLQ